MKKIRLLVVDLELGYLKEDNGYVFVANEKNIVQAKKDYLIQMRRFSLNESGLGLYNQVPPIFNDFLSGTNRQDIIEVAGIDKDDSDFEKLYKLAGIDMMPNVFDIKQG